MLMNIDLNADPDPTFHCNADPDPQLWSSLSMENNVESLSRIRPRTSKFLANISHLYEFHICTFGARLYAHTIAAYLGTWKLTH